MAKMGRGGYVFVSWAGDHTPRNVHVFKDGRPVLKWDLERDRAMSGRPSRRLLQIIRELD